MRLPELTVPGRPNCDLHRRLLLRLRAHPRRARLGTAREAGRGVEADAHVLPRPRRGHVLVNVPFLDLSRNVRALRDELEAAVQRTPDEAQFVLRGGGGGI